MMTRHASRRAGAGVMLDGEGRRETEHRAGAECGSAGATQRLPLLLTVRQRRRTGASAASRQHGEGGAPGGGAEDGDRGLVFRGQELSRRQLTFVEAA